MKLDKKYKINLEFKILLVLLIIIFSTASWWKTLDWSGGHGDSAFVVELYNNISNTGKPTSSLMSSIDSVLNTVVISPAEKLCKLPLANVADKDFNYFKKWHTYLILYVLAPLAWFFSPVGVLSSLTILSFFSLILIIYIAARRRGLPILQTVLISLSILVHPAWSYAIQGQLYVDRLFLGPTLLLIFLLNDFNNSRRFIFTFGLLATLVSDRTGLIAGGIMIGHEILNRVRGKEMNIFNIKAGLLFCAISIYLMKYVVEHPHYGSFSSSLSPDQIIKNLADPIFSSNLKYFSFINLLVFGSIAIFSPKYFILSLCLMIPNIFGNLGGAEKTGFYAHYHTLYFPTLIWAFMDGYVNLYKKLKDLAGEFKTKLILSLTSSLIIFIICGTTSLSGAPFSYIKGDFFDEAIFTIPKNFVSYNWGDKKKSLNKFVEIKNLVPKGARILTTEPFMTHFVLDYELYFFPIGLENAEYVLLPYTKSALNEYSYFGATTYLGADEANKINICLKERMRMLSFNVDNPIIFDDMALLKRIN